MDKKPLLLLCGCALAILGFVLWKQTGHEAVAPSSLDGVSDVPSLLPKAVEHTSGPEAPSSPELEMPTLLNHNEELQRILADTDYSSRELSLLDLVDRWVVVEPLAVLDNLKELRGISRAVMRSCIEQVFQFLLEELDPGEVWELATPLEANRRLVAQETLIRHFAATDPEMALEWFTKISSLRGQELAVDSIVAKLGHISLNDAVKWIDQLHYERVQEKAILQLNDIIEKNSADVHQALNETTSPQVREVLIDYEASRKAMVDFDSLLQWSESLSEEERHIAVQKGLATVIGRDLDRAVELAQENATSIQQSSWKHLAQAMAERDISKASEWIIKQDPSLAEHTVEPLMRHWLKYEPLGASQWAVDLEPGVFRDQAAHEISDYLIRKGDFEDARIWIEEIEEGALKDSNLSRLPTEEE